MIADLLEWVAQHYAEVDSDINNIARRRGDFEGHDKYWPTIYRLVCQGRTQEACELLRLHRRFPRPEHSNNGLGYMEDILQKMPFLYSGEMCDYEP